MTPAELDDLDKLLATATAPDPPCTCPNFGHYEPDCAKRTAKYGRDEARLTLRTRVFEHAPELLRLARLGLRRERAARRMSQVLHTARQTINGIQDEVAGYHREDDFFERLTELRGEIDRVLKARRSP